MRYLGVFLLAGALLSCRSHVPEVSPEEGAAVAEVARPAVSGLMSTLVGRLTAALAEGGPEAAVDLCSTEAIPLTRRVESGLDEPLRLKRTSFRYRNPENAPDPPEEEALRFFESVLLEEGNAPPYLVQRPSEGEYRYYQPLFVGEMCLSCHGDPETLSPAVRQALAQRYAGDLAVGYEAGDFRGVVRVSVPAEILEGLGG